MLEAKEQLIESLETQLRLILMQTDGNPFVFIPMGHFRFSFVELMMKPFHVENPDIPKHWMYVKEELEQIQALP